MYGIVVGLISAALFGVSTPLSKALLSQLTPLQLAGLLYLGGALGVAPLVLWKIHRGEQRLRMDRRNAMLLAGAVMLGGLLGPVLLLMGLRASTAGSVALVLNLEMAWTALLGLLLFGESLRRLGILGVVGIVVSGVLISADGGWPGTVAGLLVAAACLCWGFDNHFTALIDGITPFHSTFVKGSVAGTVNLLLGLASAPFVASWEVVVAALAVGTLAYGVSIALYISSAQMLGATRAQGLFATAPFIGAGCSFLFLHEEFGFLYFVGAAVLVPAVVALTIAQHSHLHRHERVEHIHSHSHDDDHHLHSHDDTLSSDRHTHWHRHDERDHSHPHWPDIHHRHQHD